jgi:hypothetical protein
MSLNGRPIHFLNYASKWFVRAKSSVFFIKKILYLDIDGEILYFV